MPFSRCFSISRFQELNAFSTAKFRSSWKFWRPTQIRHLFWCKHNTHDKISGLANSWTRPITDNISFLSVYTTRDKLIVHWFHKEFWIQIVPNNHKNSSFEWAICSNHHLQHKWIRKLTQEYLLQKALLETNISGNYENFSSCKLGYFCLCVAKYLLCV